MKLNKAINELVLFGSGFILLLYKFMNFICEYQTKKRIFE